MGSLTGRVFKDITDFNLTEQGTTDWKNWGLSPLIRVVSKNEGSGDIEDYVVNTDDYQTNDYGPDIEWSDGAEVINYFGKTGQFVDSAGGE